MDTTDLIGTIVELTIPLVAGVGLFFLRHLSTWLKAKEEENVGFFFAANLAREVNDYIDDAASVAVGELAEFRRPESEGGHRITDRELNRYAKAIAAKLLREAAGESWLQRGARVLGVGVQSPALQAKVERTVKRHIRAREDAAGHNGRGRVASPPSA